MRIQSLETRAVHSGRDDLSSLGVHAVPIDLSTTYPLGEMAGQAERIDAFAAGEVPAGSPIYGRLGNPTVARFEAAVAELEGCASAVAFSTGMAALTACLLANVARGKPHVVAVRPLYGGSDHLLGSGLLGTTVTWTTPQELAGAVRLETGLVIVETPANPTLTEHDIAKLAAAAGEVPLMVDNTFATPVLQRPAAHGARIVMHSATKFLGGHGDVMGGIVACDEDFARLLRQNRVATGAVLHPFAAYLLLRGLSTLPVRVLRSAASAALLVRRLGSHARVSRVYYPGPDAAERPAGQLDGGGCLVSFEVAGDPLAVMSAVELITPAVSLGGVDTLIQHPASLTHRVVGREDRQAGGIGDRLLRLSVGLEDPADLWYDLERALAA